jgi:hypothetical protein
MVAGAAAPTVKNTVVVWLCAPLCPQTVIGKVASGVPEVVVIVRFADPAPFTVEGLKLAVAPAGNPEALNPTLPLNPALVFTEIEYPATPVGAMVCDDCAAVSVKSAAPATISQTVAE